MPRKTVAASSTACLIITHNPCEKRKRAHREKYPGNEHSGVLREMRVCIEKNRPVGLLAVDYRSDDCAKVQMIRLTYSRMEILSHKRKASAAIQAVEQLWRYLRQSARRSLIYWSGLRHNMKKRTQSTRKKGTKVLVITVIIASRARPRAAMPRYKYIQNTAKPVL